MHFSKLRVSGFKSFVDPTEVLIEDGMTGVVGPNGCGKSNVVEALRWVMGETSAKSMRGGEMDDVIFGGTASRPARNIAEVVLHLDNADRTAPAAFNNSEELEISRRIERGAGSTYRINGKETRARDVQLLFADMATGAHSTAMVSQGRIGALIGAKPTERRTLLEEAAGIKGLHSRRHEAELRLRAAETNLERLDDVIGALEGQFQALKRQVRQASRYRRLSEQIRKHEAILLHLRWEESKTALQAARNKLQEAEVAVAQQTALAGEAATAQAEAAAALPDLRTKEAEAAAELQRLIIARSELEREEARITEAQSENNRRLAQIASDIERESALATDAQAALQRLADEADKLNADREGEVEMQASAQAELRQATEATAASEQALNDLTTQRAEAEARRQSLTRQQEQLTNRLRNLRTRAEEQEAARAKAAAEAADETAVTEAAEAVSKADASLDAIRRESEAKEQILQATRKTEAEARQAADEVETAYKNLQAEIRALAELVDPQEADLFAPLIEGITVDPGYEKAFGAALGEDIDASVDSAAPVYWSELPPYAPPPPLPTGTRPLATHVKGATTLARRLSQIGIVENAEQAAALHDDLQPGQLLVTLDGAAWRWDGYTITAGAPTPAAIRLGQRNRLAALRAQLDSDTPQIEQKRAAVAAATDARSKAEIETRTAQENLQRAFAALNQAQQRHADASRANDAAQSRLSALADAIERTAADQSEAAQQLETVERAIADLDDPAIKAQEIDRLRRELAEQRAAEAEKRSVFDQLRREAETRRVRLSAIQGETQSWRDRAQGTQSRLADLEVRQQEENAEKERLSALPAEIAEKRKTLFAAIEQSEARRDQAADALAAGETRQTETDRALRAAESALASMRENRIRCEGHVEQTENDERAVVERITERLDCTPSQVLAAAEIGEDEEIPDRHSVEAKFERFSKERDRMGPVNLRAEAEAEELETQIVSMQSEREDLVAAIARLRQGISALNREGRERLLAAFETVNTHFQELFVKLFGGGRAHLALTEADDPLEAGLEIMASPPGKKLQIMSLLSGGEQALTAIALLFGVFLTNPAPICVLDEVDAPLDDANVDRFCALLDHIAHHGETRFIVITHHRITMARMDRLFGVTMGEQGVSQLVSVDLQGATALRQSA